MAEAREVLDRLNGALFSHDWDGVRACYAPDVVGESPEGRFEGREALLAFLTGYETAFPDFGWERRTVFETGDTAVDEGAFVGTNTGPVAMPDGSELEPTGRRVELPETDVITVRNGVVVSHRFYYDTATFERQLGFAEQEAAVPAPRDTTEAEQAASV